MNIFFIERDPVVAARSMVNAHVVKMILETAQLLDTAHVKSVVPRPASIFNNPAAIWVRENNRHYSWLQRHFEALLEEFAHRFGKPHAYEKLSENFKAFSHIQIREWRDPPKLMPYEFQNHSSDTLECYREYYRVAKRELHQWKRRSPPLWLQGSAVA